MVHRAIFFTTEILFFVLVADSKIMMFHCFVAATFTAKNGSLSVREKLTLKWNLVGSTIKK